MIKLASAGRGGNELSPLIFSLMRDRFFSGLTIYRYLLNLELPDIILFAPFLVNAKIKDELWKNHTLRRDTPYPQKGFVTLTTHHNYNLQIILYLPCDIKSFLDIPQPHAV